MTVFFRYTDKATLLSAINNLSYYKGGSTDMSGGLRLMSTQVFNQTGDRPDVPNTCVVITDGYPTNPSTIQAEIDRIRRDAIRTLVVGVTNKVDMSTITRLASPPAQVIWKRIYYSLTTLVEEEEEKDEEIFVYFNFKQTQPLNELHT